MKAFLNDRIEVGRFTYIFFLVLNLLVQSAAYSQPIRVVIAGLNHDHVHGILKQFKEGYVNVIGIAEPDKQLQAKYAKLYQLPDSIFFTDLKSLLIQKKPEAVLGYNSAAGHLSVVRICAPLGISVMVEKPLAATLDQAIEMEALAKKYKISVLTNFETTWYGSYQKMFSDIENDSIGKIKKMIVHDGHQGPKEIGCSEAFLSWLTDSLQNGAGALNDFGCYGADLMTWLMKGTVPTAVTAITRHYKPAIYPKVDDDATVILEYPAATGIIEASWNWPFSIKDLEIFGETGYLHGLDGSKIESRKRENIQSSTMAQPPNAPATDAISYLSAVLRNQISGDNDLSSLKYNMIVMRILDAAKRSAREGRRIILE